MNFNKDDMKNRMNFLLRTTIERVGIKDNALKYISCGDDL